MIEPDGCDTCGCSPMVLISSLQAEHDVPSCCHPAWNHSCFCTCLRADHKAGCWFQNIEPNTKIFATPQGNIRPALPFPSEQERVGSAQLHPTSTCRASSLRAPPSPGQPPGVAVMSTGGGSRCHHHPGPGHHTACKCAPCTASMVSGLDKFLPSEGFVHHR